MKNLLLLMCLIAVNFNVSAQKGAQIEFKETTINYGKIEYNSDGIRIFEFANIGDSPLVITSAKSTCGCTVLEKPKTGIAPGEK